MKIRQFIRERLRSPFVSGNGHIKAHETFHEELNNQCGGIIFVAALIATFAWLPYILIDRQLYPGEPLIVALRIGLSLVGLTFLALQFFKRFYRYNLLLLIILSAYLEIATGLITGLTKADPSYLGGYFLVLTLLALVPITRWAAWSILALSLASFFAVGFAHGMHFDSVRSQYSLNDLLGTVLVVALFIYLLDRLRFNSWENRFKGWEKSKKIEQQNEALRRSEEQYRLLAENSDDVIWTTDTEMRFTYISPSSMKLRGLTVEEAMQEKLEEIMTPESLNRVLAEYNRALPEIEQGKNPALQIEIEQYRKDHSTLWVEISTKTIRDNNGRLSGFLGVSRDISHRKKAEEALRESEEKLRLILNTIPHAISIWDMNLSCSYVSPSIQRMLGYTPEELMALTLDQLITPESMEIAMKAYQEDQELEQSPDFSGHNVRILELDLRHKNGSVTPFENTITFLRDVKGVPVGIINLAMDISERKRVEEALRESEARYRTLFERAAVGVAEIEHVTGRFLTANPRLCKLLGRTEEEMRDTTFQAITHPDDLHLHEDKSEQLLAGTIDHYTLEKRYISKDGAVIWVNITVSNPEGTGRTHGRNIVVVEDITERKRTEAALQASEEKFRQIVNSIPNAVSMLDMNLRFTYVSAGVQRILGYTPEEAMTFSLDQICTPESLAIGFKTFQERLEANTKGSDPNYVLILELEQYHKNGSTVCLENTMAFLRDANGVPVGILCVAADISERKRASDALRKSEEQYRLLAENSDDVIFTLDNELRFTYVSPASFKLRGVTAEEAMHEKMDEIMTPASLNTVLAEYSRYLPEIEQGKNPSVRMELKLYRKDGSTLWAESSMRPMRNDEGRMIGYLGVNRDISDRKKAEEALRESESKYRFLIENSNDIVWTYDLKKMAYSFCSNSIEPILGYSCEEAVGMKLNDIFSPETKKTVSSAFAKIIADPATTDRVLVEAEHIAKDGRKVWMEINAVLQKDNDGKPAFLSGVSRDITERRRAEVALRASEEKFRQIVENASDFIYRLSSTGAFTFINPAAELLLGYSIANIQNHYFWDIIPDSHKKDVISFYADMLQRQVRDSYYEFPIILKNGAIMWVGQIIKREENAEGGVEFLGIARDISERKHSEAKFKEAKDAAEAANRSKSVFLANMSHEIRTPMNAILGFAQLMRRDPSLSQQSGENLDIINRSGEHLLALINDILEMSKIEAGRSVFASTTFDLQALVYDLERMFRLRTDSKNLRFLVEKIGHVPRWVITDEGKLRQVLINLLGNAVKFTEEGGIVLRLGGKVENTGTVHLQFEVEDTGPGMAEEEIGRLFQAFEQTKSGIKSGGTGLGLALSKGFIELMDGSISVTSRVGKGTIFRFNIPVKEASEGQASPQETKQRVLCLRPGQNEIRVLIADDRETNRLLLLQMLGAVGFATRDAVNGAEAVQMVQEWKPQVVLMDMAMPVMDGYEATRKIKESPDIKNTSIVAVTASAFDEDKQRIYAAGADGYLAKPFKDAELFEIIGRLTGAEYLYEEALKTEVEKVSETADDKSLMLKAVAALPFELVNRMRAAVESADLDLLNELAGELATDHPDIARQIQEMAARYEYERLIKLFSQESEP